MASRFVITLPNDVKLTLQYSKDQSKADLLEKMIQKPWADYCLRNWTSGNAESYKAPENKVKRLLDRCGTLLLRDVPRDEKDTLSDYMEIMNSKREINVSDCPCGSVFPINEGHEYTDGEGYDDTLRYEAMLERVDAKAKTYESKGRKEKKAEKRAKQTTRFSRMQQIEREHTNCKCQGYRVDTDGVFHAPMGRFRISPDCAQYAPHQTRYGDQYNMDRVLVYECADGQLFFADQDAYLIDEKLIERLDK